MTHDKTSDSDAVLLRAQFTGVSWRDLTATAGPILLVCLVAIWAVLWVVHPAPPDTITITSGAPGSTFYDVAESYRRVLARNGVTLRILPSQGSQDNLTRLIDRSFQVDVGFVQGGVAPGTNTDKLVSLGSIFHLPLSVFYRGSLQVNRLSELSGKRLAIGAPGGGARSLALTLLKANGIEAGGTTTFVDLGAEDGAQALVDGKVDAVFLTRDSSPIPLMRKLLQTDGINLLDFSQAEAYTRRFPYLTKLVVPMGTLDLGKNVPAHDINLIGATVELVAREGLHPALSDLLIEAAREVHGGASSFQRAGEFPAPIEHEFRISDDAMRYYNSGKSFLYRNLPFWLASLTDRMLVVLVPIAVLLIPAVQLVPALYRWRIGSRIYRWYGALLALERDLGRRGSEHGDELLRRLDRIEKAVARIKVPLAYANQFYLLRQHVSFVREQLSQGASSTRRVAKDIPAPEV